MKKIYKLTILIVFFILFVCSMLYSNQYEVKVKGKSQKFYSSETVEIENYGDSIRYGIDLNNNGDYTDDWIIFYKADEVYIIARDYLKKDALEKFSNNPGCSIESTDSSQIKWNLSDRDNIISKLLDYEDVWNGLLTPNLLKNGGMGFGAPTLEQWLKSWNDKYGKDGNIIEYSTTDFYKDLASTSGFNDELYFPYKSTARDTSLGSHNGCYGYWLASEQNSDMHDFQLMRIDCDGYIYSSSYKEQTFALRPVVRVPMELVKYDYMFYVDEGNGMKFEPKSTPEGWTNKDVTFSIENIENVDLLQIQIPSKLDKFQEYETYTQYSGPVTITKNCKINIKAKTGIEEKNIPYNVTNIDKNKPVKLEITDVNPGYNSFSYKFSFQDEEKVPLSGLCKIETYIKVEFFDGKSAEGMITKEYKTLNGKVAGDNRKTGTINSNSFYEAFGGKSECDKGGKVTFYVRAYDVAGNYIETEKQTFETLKYQVIYEKNLLEDDVDDVRNMPNKQEHYYGETITIDKKIPKRDKYGFIGWATSKYGDVIYFPNSDNSELQEYKYSDNSDLTLYAIWQQVYEITLDNEFDYKSYYGTSSKEIFSEGYSGTVKSITLMPGTYKLEVWGAQGGGTSGYQGGKGGYSVGIYTITETTTLYVAVGQTNNSSNATRAYNGGGAGGSGVVSGKGIPYGFAGGGATHIATVSGELKNLSSYKNQQGVILIVAGGRRRWR